MGLLSDMTCVWIRLCTEPFPRGGVEKEEGLTCLLHMPLFLFPISHSVSPERSTHMFAFHHWAPSPGHSAKSRNGGRGQKLRMGGCLTWLYNKSNEGSPPKNATGQPAPGCGSVRAQAALVAPQAKLTMGSPGADVTKGI